jgi:hypothetical protein
MMLNNVQDNIQIYNRFCLHYNLTADAIYRKLKLSCTPFSDDYESYIIAALVSFDMERMMGKGLVRKYDFTAGGFASRLHSKLSKSRRFLEPIIYKSLIELNLDEHSESIVNAYKLLADGGTEGLHEQGDDFHVGATKILHFMNPELFMIIDRNTAKALKEECNIPFRNTTQPGYTAELYVRSLKSAKSLIIEYGEERFRALEPGTPLMRIFDKIAFTSAGVEQ